MFDRLRNTEYYQREVGALLAIYLRIVWKTSRFIFEPDDFYDRLSPDLPVIITLWHGQHFMGPFMRQPQHHAKALVSRHRDANINAIAAARLGMGLIRGSGNRGQRSARKGGVRAFVAMRRSLSEGCNIVTTADVPKVARVASRGIVMLARASGRPIYPIGIATSHRIQLNNWDHTTLNLPFSRGAFVLEAPIWVPSDATDSMIEACRRQVQDELNAADSRAYALVNSINTSVLPRLSDPGGTLG